MGTSNPFGGGKNGDSLMPDFLPGAGDAPDEGNQPSQDGEHQGDQNGGGRPDNDKGGQDGQDDGGRPDNDDAPPTSDYTGPRTLFNRQVRHGDGSGSGGRGGGRTPLQRAAGGYVSRTAGGSRTASSRMATSRSAASALGAILRDASDVGIRDVVRRLNLENLASRSLREIYSSLVDFVCGDGGEMEDGINRDAYLEAVNEVAEVPGIDLEKPTVETINLLIERFISGTIVNRIINAIANEIVTLPRSAVEVESIQNELKGFISGSVQDAMHRVGQIFARDQIRVTIDQIYERALAILQTFADDQQ